MGIVPRVYGALGGGVAAPSRLPEAEWQTCGESKVQVVLALLRFIA